MYRAIQQFPTASICRVLLAVSSFLGCSSKSQPGPLSPQAALASFQLKEDFRIELFATEPQVVDPVEMVFDASGRVFVTEMRDYPQDPPAGKPARSRVRLLKDTDGDGTIDESVVFADSLLQVTSMLPWKDGLLVTSAPDILYLKDTDGDGRADVRKVVFTGFALSNSEGRITSLRYCVDNWIYAANSGHPGDIRFFDKPDSPAVSVSGADFRFRLDRGQFEAESGSAQFGVAMDNWGNRFFTQNTVHVQHVVIPRRYLNRNPYLVAGPPAQDISDHGRPSARVFALTKPEGWRERRTKMRQQRYRENAVDRVERAGGYFTAASGGTIYAGDQFPEQYRGNLFTGDVSGNLIHRDLLHRDGVTFVASRAESEQAKEFLASTDPWFRPCNFANGPDGHLYIVDMYRQIIEGPDFIPEELKKGINFYSGDTLGRIYRIVPKNPATTGRVPPNLEQTPSSELVEYLSHRNVWWRLTAQRLIVERQDKTIVPALKAALCKIDSPQGRLHVLYALEGLSSLDALVVRTMLRDPHPEIRKHAVRLAEGFPELVGELIILSKDPSPAVRFQIVLSLGQFSSKAAIKALASVAFNHIDDSWFRTAVMSSAAGSSLELLRRVFQVQGHSAGDQEGMTKFLRELSSVIGARNSEGEVQGLFALMQQMKQMRIESFMAAAFSGLANGLSLAKVRGLRNPLAERFLREALTSPSECLQASARELARHFELTTLLARAEREALDNSVETAQRERAIQFLSSGSFPRVKSTFEKLFSLPLDPTLLRTTITSISEFDSPKVGDLLIKHWKRFGPEVRDLVLDVLLSHRDRAEQLLSALEGGLIESGAFTPSRREKLLHHPDTRLRNWAIKSFQDQSNERTSIVEAYRSTLDQPGDAAKGRRIFEKNCASCHWPKAGGQVGPDLSGVSSNTKAQLLQSILDPSKTVESPYRNYIVIDKEGRIHDGLIIAETSGAVTLRSGEGEDQTVLRSRISEIRASNVSLMPEGLEKGIDQRGMTDLLAFLQGGNLLSH
ncbi:MAG: HEAT repeat domain-containing protein [Acidobacteria bacterium]|nr:HEAT repeat domain-containing protein [Acidobacteriota bacterium]MCI0719658.1 HEAT repeat domain-containing protein [Acidobacteriota bacterium]